MNAIMSRVSGQDFTQRNEAIRRRNAEEAFDRQMKYNGDNEKTLSQLEALISGGNVLQEVKSSPKDVLQLGAGQVKQIAIPTGRTLEETIDLWRDVRSEAISVAEPTTADYQLAANASSKIRQTETQIGLEQKKESMPLSSVADRESHEIQKRYDRAMLSYSFHVQAKENGYEVERPSFFRVA